MVVFAVLAVLPGDPAEVAAGTQATPEQVAALRAEYGLNGSVPARYVRWLGDLVTGNLGNTFVSKRSIASEIGTRLQVTLPLVLMGMVLAVAVSIPLGIVAAIGHRRWSGTLVSALSQVGIAIPAFWAGLILITVVAVRWGLLPAGGFTPWGESAWEAFRSLLLPALALGNRASRHPDEVRALGRARGHARGLHPDRPGQGPASGPPLRRHGLRNAAVPVVTVLGLQLTTLLVGAVVVERVRHARPGQAAPRRDQQPRDPPRPGRRDDPRRRGLVVNFLVDLLYARPRSRACGARVVKRPLNPSLIVGGVLVASSSWWLLSSRSSGRRTTRRSSTPAARLLAPSWSHRFGHRQLRPRRAEPDHGRRADDAVRRRRRGRRSPPSSAYRSGSLAAIARRWPSARRSCAPTTCCFAFPAILLAIMFAAVFGAQHTDGDGRHRHRIGAGLRPADRARGALQVMWSEYVLAARAVGTTADGRSFVRHVLPNVRRPAHRAGVGVVRHRGTRRGGAVVPRARHAAADAVVGPDAAGEPGVLSAPRPRSAIFPGIAIAIAVLGFNLLGDGLRDAIDPKLEVRDGR